MSSREVLDRWADEQEVAVLLADGLDEALLGLVQQKGAQAEYVACYDRKKVIEILMKRDGMTEEEAEEFFGFNIGDAYVGPGTPCFLTRVEDLESP